KNIDLGVGALRHLVISSKNNKLYVSDMLHGTISVLNLKTDSVIKTFYAGSNINTIKLSPDGQKLFISSRGHNNENGYLQKGPDFGKIFVYDTVTKAITDWTWGGNQPTGLAISPDGSILAFTDFLDYRVEIYRIEP
ncbi:MAG: beta-propeller fold lactonase family protein, partial [Spirochaetia bacterium]|nr:beta-propeller fold lactonase family protein [Spirochaetia bacterium]